MSIHSETPFPSSICALIDSLILRFQNISMFGIMEEVILRTSMVFLIIAISILIIRLL